MCKKVIVSVLLASVIGMSGCATTGQRQNEQAGVIIGGILGGVLGSQVGKGDGRTAAIILGTLVGASIGGAIGQSMDDTDRLKTAHSLESVRTGVPTSWNNPDTGNAYTVTPTRTYEVAAGPCREYIIDAVIGGKKRKCMEQHAVNQMVAGKHKVKTDFSFMYICMFGNEMPGVMS